MRKEWLEQAGEVSAVRFGPGGGFLPWPVSAPDGWWGWADPCDDYLDFVCGPDGFAWTYLKNVLVRINPEDASVHVVGKIEPLGYLTFVGNDLYLSGSERLRRLHGIAQSQ